MRTRPSSSNALRQALMNCCDDLSLRLAAWIQARGIASALHLSLGRCSIPDGFPRGNKKGRPIRCALLYQIHLISLIALTYR